MVKTVAKLVTVAHNQTLRRLSRHDVSSMFDHLGLMDGDRQFVIGGFQGRGRLSFQLGDHPGGDLRLNRSAAICWICRLLRR